MWQNRSHFSNEKGRGEGGSVVEIFDKGQKQIYFEKTKSRNILQYISLMLAKKGLKCKKNLQRKLHFKSSNAYNVIRTYPLLTYEPTNIFTVQLPFLNCIEYHYSVILTVLTGFGHFLTYPPPPIFGELYSELDVDPRRDDDASPMSSYGCMLRPTWMFMDRMIAPINVHSIS